MAKDVIMNDKIIVAQISLHYESRDTILHEWSRERFARELMSRKLKATDWYFKRVSPAKAEQIQAETDRTINRKNYDKAIMNKYNVGSNYQSNSWFMEQVRPTLFN